MFLLSPCQAVKLVCIAYEMKRKPCAKLPCALLFSPRYWCPESREPFIDVSMIKSASNNIFGQEDGMLITRSSKALKEISFTCVNIQYTS